MRAETMTLARRSFAHSSGANKASAGRLHFSDAAAAFRPVYGLYGLGIGLYFAPQGLGKALWTVTANALRLVLSSGCALLAIYWLQFGANGLFISIPVGFCAHATLTLIVRIRGRPPCIVSRSRYRLPSTDGSWR